MSSKKGGGSPSVNGAFSSPSKGKGTGDVSNAVVDELSHGISGVGLNSGEDGGWEVFSKKNKSKGGSSSAKPLGSQQSSSVGRGQPIAVQKQGMQNYGGTGRGAGQPFDLRKPAGRGYVRPQLFHQNQSPYNAAIPVRSVPLPVNTGRAWASIAASGQQSNNSMLPRENDRQGPAADEVDDEGDESDEIDDSDDELMSDGSDSDESQKSHETRKNNRWFKDLFQSLDKLSAEQIKDPERQWHCPACKGGPGAIDWYRGLQPLIAHAKTKRSKRWKLHRELAEILEEELMIRGTSAAMSGEVYGKWKALEERADKEIVWPPMVMIMNTQVDQDDNEKWIGMGNQELLDTFKEFSAEKARHSYGPTGHRGISVLIFEASAVGYTEAERLSKSFEDHCRDRVAWSRCRMPSFTGEKRDLYGFIADKRDMDNFNRHSQGKTKLKYEIKSYQEMVVKQMKKMSEDNQQLSYLKIKVAKEQKSKKALEESYSVMAEKFRKTTEENRLIKRKIKKHHDQNKEEMDSQEQFFKESIQQFYDARNAKEETFEQSQQDQREKVTHSEASMSSVEQRVRSREEVAKFIQSQEKEMEEYVIERDNLLKAHKERMVELKRKHFEEDKALEERFDAEFDLLLKKHTPK